MCVGFTLWIAEIRNKRLKEKLSNKEEQLTSLKDTLQQVQNERDLLEEKMNKLNVEQRFMLGKDVSDGFTAEMVSKRFNKQE